MEPNFNNACPECANNPPLRHPFCRTCGMLGPRVWHSGNKAVELGDVPSEKTRTDLIRTLKTCFPSLDFEQTMRRLKTNGSILIRNIDEESGERFLDTLRPFKISGRLTTFTRRSPWITKAAHTCLFVGVPLLFLFAFLVGSPGLALFAGAGGLPLIRIVRKDKRQIPLISEQSSFDYDKWSRLALDYAEVMKHLNAKDAEVLRSLITELFDLFERLSSDSLAATVAGGKYGDFREALTDAACGATEICRLIAETDGEDSNRHRAEFMSLVDLVKNVGDRFRVLEKETVEAPLSFVESQLIEIADRIDRTMTEIRPNDTRGRLPSTKLRT